MKSSLAYIKTYKSKMLSTALCCLLLAGCSTTEQTQSGPLSQTNNNPEVESSIENFDQAIAKAKQAKLEGDWESALFAYVRSLDFDAENSNTYVEIARIQKHLKHDDFAIKSYEKAIAITPTIIEAQQAIGVHALHSRDYVKAKQHLVLAIDENQKQLSLAEREKFNDLYVPDNDTSIEAYVAYAVILDMEKRFDESRNYYQLALKVRPGSENILSNFGYSYYLNGEYRQAEDYFRRAIRVNPGFKRAWTNLGLVYIRENQYERALKTFKQVMPEHEAYNDLGYFVMLEGRLIEAEYFFHKAIELSPRYFKKAYVNLEQVDLLKREHQQSLEKYPDMGAANEEVVGNR